MFTHLYQIQNVNVRLRKTNPTYITSASVKNLGIATMKTRFAGYNCEWLLFRRTLITLNDPSRGNL